MGTEASQMAKGNATARLRPMNSSRKSQSHQSAPQHAVDSISNWLSGLPDSQTLPMPSPNAAQKSSAKKAGEKKGVDLAPKLAKKRSQDFKSKIAGWDNTAGNDAADDEVVVIVEEEEKSTKDEALQDEVVVLVDDVIKENEGKDAPADAGLKTPKTPKSGAKPGDKQSTQRKSSREVDPANKVWVRRKSKAPVDLAAEVKEATTPKKRVVSDGHWRRDRAKKDDPSPEKEPEKVKQKDTTPKPVTIKRSVATVGVKSSPPVQDKEERDPEPKRVTRVARRSRSRDRVDSKEGTPDYETSGTKLYVKRRRRSRENDDKHRNGISTSSNSLAGTSSFGKRSSETDITIPDLSPTKAPTPRPSTAPRERLANRLTDDVPPRKRSADAEDVSRRVSKGKLQKDQKDLVTARAPATKPLPAPVPGVFGNRIQGWLSEMPEDPFTAPSEPSIVSDPPRRRSKRYTTTDDEYENVRRRSSGGARRSRPSAGYDDEDCEPRTPGGWNSVGDWDDDATPTGLRRSGARRSTYSPVKERTMRGVSGTPASDPQRRRIPSTTTRRFTYNEATVRTHVDPRDRLPTIASNDTLRSRALPPHPQLSIDDGSMLSRASDGDEPTPRSHGLKRTLTKHSDLMSILSQPRDDGKRGVGRTRSRRTHDHSTTLADLMNDVSTDELRYRRELRTLVEGVIPVLLTNVISKGDAGKAPGTRKTSLHDNPALTQPIYDMGISLERLQLSHKRIPMHDANELLRWAESTARQYSEYLRAWCLGFKDTVVLLAPREEAAITDSTPKLDSGVGVLASGDGERANVGFLLKQPLVRIKHLCRTLEAISELQPSALADDMAATYQQLEIEAKRRWNGEKARLEDEAAAAIDPTRARDPRNLVQLAGVHIDTSRSVRARDDFDMQLIHSSGQQLGCRVELIRRDNAISLHGQGDILFCEKSPAGRWLLFPPVLASHVTARKGDRADEIVVMIRGFLPGGSEWRELMSLRSDEEQGDEWVQMLGSNPMPPKLSRHSSFNTLRLPSRGQERPPSPTESVVPFGERASSSAQRWDGSQVNSRSAYSSTDRNGKSKRYYGLSTATAAAATQRDGPSSDNEVRSRYRHVRSKTEWTSDHKSSGTSKDYNVWLPSSDRDSEESADEDDRPARRPTLHRRTSSVPSQNMPTIAKVRKTSPQDSTPGRKASAEDPASAPGKLQKKTRPAQDAKEPFTPTQSSRPTSLGLRSGALPSFTPAFLKKHRRSSSPLKHEYEPSTASESSDDNELSDVDDNESITSNSTVEEEEAVSTLGELKNFSNAMNARSAGNTPRRSSRSIDQDTLRPSDSPSQAPYRGVPPSNSGSAKSVACMLAWNNNSGTWNSLHPEECEIVVTPGLVEAFDLAQAHAVANKVDELEGPSPSAYGVKPLVALELTPLVPIRQGTALDISVTSPPTANSVLRGSNNIMFRSRNPEECAKLYSMINRARIDNPTWIALQNARGPQPTSNWGAVMEQRNNARADASPSWMKSLSRKASSYRSKGPRSASIAASQASMGTMHTVSSALRKFGGGSRFFNIAKSTIVSRDGTKSSGSDSFDSGAATPVPIDPRMGTPIGMTNTKCRLYNREDSMWRNMGAARVTVMHPPRPDPSVPADPNTIGLLKRVLVVGKSRGETLLDVTLEERCFERVGRTGIAVTIWHENVGPNGELGHATATGGVGPSQTRKFLLHMNSERETAYIFNMVGKLRY